MKLIVETNLLFTYGTMRPEAYNNPRISRAKHLGRATTCEPMIMVGRERPRQIPYVGRVDASHHLYGNEVPIVGDLYLMDGMLLNRVDAAEGHPHYYTRELAYVRTDDGVVTPAWIYTFPIDEDWGTLIPTGDFLSYYSPEKHELMHGGRFWG